MFSFSRHQQHHHHPRFEQRVHGHHGGGGGRGSRGPKMFDAGALRLVVLQLIAEQPRHGYDIIKEIEERAGGGYSPSPGVIYPLLSMLEDLGHVAVTADGNKKLHTVTAEGTAFLEQNRALVDAVQARLPGAGHGRGSSGLRASMHALKGVVIERAQQSQPGDARLERIQQILQRAADEIRGLD